MTLLCWLSRRVFRHRWSWLSNLTWDWQLKRDAAKLMDVLFKDSDV